MQTVQRLYHYFKPNKYNISLVLDREQHTFRGTVNIEGIRNVDYDIFRLHSKDLLIDSINVNGKQADYTIDETNDELIITPPDIDQTSIIVTVVFSGKITPSMHGIYSSKYSQEGKEYELIATQFESHHAREAFPCVDEPQAKAFFEVTLRTETDVTVLGNMPIALQRQENNQLLTKFEKTPLMSSYLLAFVVGRLHKKTTQTKDGVEVNVWATPAQSPDSLEFALGHAVKTIEFFNEYFGVPYPLPKSDHVALPDFSSGAMENWGLVTYRETALLADPATTTVASKQYIATVVSHELSHMWFGNLVTMKWWNDLWLNESFATLMEYVAVDAIHPEWNIWLDFAANESTMALRRDSMQGVQSVRVEVNHPDEIGSLFDGAIVYAKGARLLNMLKNYIGDEAFRAGLRTYFESYAYQNTEAEDLWTKLSTASGKDISNFMNPWLTQPGYPVIRVTNDSVSQKRFFIGPHSADNTVWRVPLFPSTSEDSLLTEPSHPIRLSHETFLNRNNSAHFITLYEDDHFEALCHRVKNKNLPTIVRLSLLSEQLLLSRAGNASSNRLVELLRYYKNEDNDIVWEAIARTVSELKQFVERDGEAEKKLKSLSFQMIEDLYHKLGWRPIENETTSDKKLRETILSLATYSDSPEVIEVLDSIYCDSSLNEIDPEIRPLILSSVVKRNDGMQVVESLFKQYSTTNSADMRSDIQTGITSVRQPEQIQYVLSQLKDTNMVRTQDIASWFIHMIRNRFARDTAWRWLLENWSWIDKQFSGDKSYDYFPRYAATGLTTQEQLDEYIAFFTPLRAEPSLTRTIDIGIVEIQAKIDLLNRDTKAVCQALRNL